MADVRHAPPWSLVLGAPRGIILAKVVYYMLEKATTVPGHGLHTRPSTPVRKRGKSVGSASG